MVEHVPRMQHEIDVAGEDVGDGGFEAAFDVDRALISTRLRVGFAVGGVTEMCIRQVGNSEFTSR